MRRPMTVRAEQHDVGEGRLGLSGHMQRHEMMALIDFPLRGGVDDLNSDVASLAREFAVSTTDLGQLARPKLPISLPYPVATVLLAAFFMDIPDLVLVVLGWSTRYCVEGRCWESIHLGGRQRSILPAEKWAVVIRVPRRGPPIAALVPLTLVSAISTLGVPAS
jgi:hypothetical protein